MKNYSHVRFHWLTGDTNYLTYGGKWISNKLSNGEFDYYLVIEILNWKESVPEQEAPPETYNVTLSVVSPQQAAHKMQEAYDCCGIDIKALEHAKENGYLDAVQVEALYDYAGGVVIRSENGNNWKKLMKQAREEAQAVECLFGFYLDKTVNRIGETGWEALRLADTREILDRVLSEDGATNAHS